MWDIIIVGAGPAGTTAATLLAEKGHRVLLLDKATFPREKPCGEYLSPGCLPILDRIGVLQEVVLKAQPIQGMRVAAPDGTTFTAEYPNQGHGLAIPRLLLDDLLLTNAKRRSLEGWEGFRVERLLLEGEKVSGVQGRSGKREVTLRAKLVIGADGRNSIVARNLGLFRWHPSHRKMALVAHYEGVEGEGYGEVFVGPQGYTILNPLGEGLANVSVVVDCKAFAPARGPLAAYLATTLKGFEPLRGRLQGARPLGGIRAIGPLAHRALMASWDGVLLIGDAAGFYDPFTGEGLYMALRSAELAAEVAHRALEADDPSAQFLKRYDTLREQEFRGRLRLDATLQWIIARPFLANVLAKRLKAKKAVADFLLGIVGDIIPPEEALSFGFLAQLLP